MSHFTVMVIGDDADAQLAPFHEYECTGNDDEYVIDVDQTDEIEEWLKEILWVGVAKESGNRDYYFSEKGAIEHLEEDWSTVSRQAWIESKGEDLDEEISEWFGSEKYEDGKHYCHTNPNAKWDWYQIGGRWSGFFKVKDVENATTALGERSWANAGAPETPQHADITTKGNIDIEGMMDDIRVERNTEFDELVAAMGDTTPVSWTVLREGIVADGGCIDDARSAYQKTPFNKAIAAYNKEHGTSIGDFFGNIYDDYYLHLPLNQARVRFVETAALNVITPYAFVKDSQWVQRGEMGWWGMSSNEVDKDEWAKQFLEMFKGLPDDTLITIADCHI